MTKLWSLARNSKSQGELLEGVQGGQGGGQGDEGWRETGMKECEDGNKYLWYFGGGENKEHTKRNP